MIQNINGRAAQEIMPKPAQRNGQGAAAPSQVPVDATLQIQYAPLVAQAIQGSESDCQAVQRAQALLASGQLDSVEAIRAAAQDLADFGI
jgi:hypothetical protein